MNWNEWLKTNELTWAKWNKWIEIKQLIRMNWAEWMKWLNWHEWIDMNELKRMNLNEWIEINDVTWMNWNEWLDRMNWRKCCNPLTCSLLRFLYEIKLSLHSRAHFVDLILKKCKKRQFLTIFVSSTTWWRCGRQMKSSFRYSCAHTLSTSWSIIFNKLSEAVSFYDFYVKLSSRPVSCTFCRPHLEKVQKTIVFDNFSVINYLIPESVWAKGSSNSGGLSSHLLITSSHLHTCSSSCSHLIFLSSQFLIFIFSSSHLHIWSSSSSHHIFSSSQLLIFIFTPSHRHIFTSSHLHIFTSSHLLIFTSSHLYIFTSSHLFSLALLPSCSLALLPSCLLAFLPSCPLLSPSFLFLS